jgi:hypothetical protein
MICHLDYTDETHPNSISGFLLRAVPYVVIGPHYHSSSLNICRGQPGRIRFFCYRIRGRDLGGSE